MCAPTAAWAWGTPVLTNTDGAACITGWCRVSDPAGWDFTHPALTLPDQQTGPRPQSMRTYRLIHCPSGTLAYAINSCTDLEQKSTA